MYQINHLLVVLFCLFGASYSLLSFKASFTVTSPNFKNGYFTGTITYDYNKKAFNLFFPKSSQYSELYSFNSKGGMDPNFGNGQFFGQTLYRTSLSCPCETTTLTYYIPHFFTNVAPTTKIWESSGKNIVVGDVNCTGYQLTSNHTNNSLVKEYWEDKDGNPCQFLLEDGRTFTLSDVNAENTDNSGLTAPTGCKCGKPIDIVVSLDRSSSISVNEFKVERQFTFNLTQKFDFGPLKANMGILNWKKNRWTQIPLIEGTSLEKVNAAINAMGCNAGQTGDNYCTCCGTPIGGALWDATREMLTSTRQSTKMVILLTDGCQNHVFKGPPDLGEASVSQCTCSNEKACASDSDCKTDLATWSRNLKDSVPGVKIITIGVGNDQQICPEQLTLANGGVEANYFRAFDWSGLSALVDVIAAQACSLSDSPCKSDTCCGICSCGNCLSPEACNAPDKCSQSKIDPTVSKCCITTPLVCEAKKCMDAVCLPDKGCDYISTQCEQPSDPCLYSFCDINTAIGSCSPPTRNTTQPGCNCVGNCNTEPQCNTTKPCRNTRKCFERKCVNDVCVESALDCGESDKCTTRYCDIATGLCQQVNLTCNDGNKCTIDTCDPLKGCDFIDIQCPISNDACLIPSCNKEAGCYNDVVNCSNFPQDPTNCTIWSCRNGTCRNSSVCLPPPIGTPEKIEVVVGAALGTAAIVGIIIAIIVALAALAGGGAYAIAGGGGAGMGPQIGNNPLYAGNKANSVNPLYKAT